MCFILYLKSSHRGPNSCSIQSKQIAACTKNGCVHLFFWIGSDRMTGFGNQCTGIALVPAMTSMCASPSLCPQAHHLQFFPLLYCLRDFDMFLALALHLPGTVPYSPVQTVRPVVRNSTCATCHVKLWPGSLTFVLPFFPWLISLLAHHLHVLLQINASPTGISSHPPCPPNMIIPHDSFCASYWLTISVFSCRYIHPHMAVQGQARRGSQHQISYRQPEPEGLPPTFCWSDLQQEAQESHPMLAISTPS